MRKLYFTLCFFAISANYTLFWHKIFPDEYSKPFIYRQLVQTLTDIIPLSELYSLIYVEVFFCIGLGLLMLHFYEKNYKVSFSNDVAIVLAFGLVIAVLNYSFPWKKYYDAPTAFFFLLLFILWQEEKYLLSIPVFALACINRETTILIVPILIFMRPQWGVHIFQVLFFIGLRVIMTNVFADFPGDSIWIRPEYNLAVHAENIRQTIEVVIFSSIILLLFFRNVPRLDLSAVVFVGFLLPVSFVLYIICGNAFELRVFAEVMPMLFMGAFLTPD